MFSLTVPLMAGLMLGRWRVSHISEARCGTGRPGNGACGACCWVRFLWSLTLGIVGIWLYLSSQKRDVGAPSLVASLRMELRTLRVDWVCWELPHPGFARVGHPALPLHGDVLLREGIGRA
jgi:hypothetical protein